MSSPRPILSSSAIVTFDDDFVCEDHALRIVSAEGRNMYAVMYGSGPVPSVRVSRGTLTEKGAGVEASTLVEEFSQESELPDNALVHIQVSGLYYGYREVETQENYVLFEFRDSKAKEICGNCVEDDDAILPARMFAYSVILPGSQEPCVAVAIQELTYECGDHGCEEPASIGIRQTETGVVVDAPDRPGEVHLHSPGLSFTFREEEPHTRRTARAFSAECELPTETLLSHRVIDGLHYGVVEDSEPRVEHHYNVVVTDGATDLMRREGIPMYAYWVEGLCSAVASGRYTIRESTGDQTNPCWVELSHEGGPIVHLSFGGTSLWTPHIRAINASIEQVGYKEETSEKIIEFSDMTLPPSGAIFSKRIQGRYYGMAVETETIGRRIYEVTPTDGEGRESIYVYAYMSPHGQCYAYDQIVVPPLYDEPQHEEYEVYRVCSQVITTSEGTYAAPGPDFNDQIREIFEDLEDEDGQSAYLLTEIVHEQGYINQLHRKSWARPETHNHRVLPFHPLLVEFLPIGNFDRYIRWTPPQRIDDSNSSVVPGGRRLYDIYHLLDNSGGIPAGVAHRHFGVRILDPT